MDKSIFRAYSIRGIFGETLTASDMSAIGQAAGTMLGERGVRKAVIGRDHRHSSAELSDVLGVALVSTGIDLLDIGTCPTPLLNFATDTYSAGAGFMVTASHNPPSHNGLKVRTDHTLAGDELQAIYRLALTGLFRRGRGARRGASPLAQYLDAICQRVTMGRPLRVVVDAGNGSAGPVVTALLARLGCQVIPLGCDPDGSFPNRVPDPTAPGALDDLSSHVIAEGADAGLAYDGDGDRLVMVDDSGDAVFADRLLALLSREALASQPGGKIVYEWSCTQALPETIESLGGTPVPCPVGYAFVHQAMRDTGAVLGGETAGHIFFADPQFRFDDAMLASAKMTALLSRASGPLSALLAKLPAYALSPHYRLYCPDDIKSEVVARVSDHFAAQGCRLDHLDGVKVYFDGGWGLLRVSNTQPAVTLRCEARSPPRLAEIEKMMLAAVQEAFHHLGIESDPGA